MLEIVYTTKFKKEYKIVKKRGRNERRYQRIYELLGQLENDIRNSNR